MKSRSKARSLLPGAWSFPRPARGPAANVPLELLPGGDGDQAQAQYRGEYAGLSQSARYQVYLGDAWTDPLALSVTPLPVVEIEAEVVPPVYARQSADEVQKLPRGMRQFSVLAGSEVRLTAGQRSPLEGGGSDDRRAEYLPDATARMPSAQRRGSLDAGHRRHAAGIRCRGTVVFDSGPRRGRPNPWSGRWKGSITIEPDQPPGIMATTKTPIVLPTGSPNIHYEAADDHALGCIWLTWEATTGDVRPTAGRESARAGSRSAASRPEASPRSRAGRLSAWPSSRFP